MRSPFWRSVRRLKLRAKPSRSAQPHQSHDADEMQKLPDVNTGEAIRRVPGISLETDTGRDAISTSEVWMRT